MKKRVVSLIIVLIAALALVSLVQAQDPIDPRPPMPPIDDFPRPPFPPVGGLKIEYQRVDVQIEDQIATTHIDQLFVNDNDWLLEGTYLFPLPPGAMVTELTMWVNGEPIEAKVLAADEARQIYDDIVRQLRDPALLEYVGTGAVQANVFPIPPFDERRVEIEYSQVLAAENGLFHYLYPQSSDLYTNLPLENQSIRVEITSDEAIRAVYSPSHPVAIDREGEFHVVAGYEDSNVKADQDFELYYNVAPEEIGLNLLSYKESDQDGFFLLLVAPTVKDDPEAIVAKDVILVLDTSGSMAGEKMAQAKDAASYVVDNLNPRDRFNVISFSTGVRNYDQELVLAEEPGNYQNFINSLEALGGTNISGALLEAIAQAESERPTTIIFLTDGLATEGIVDSSLLLDTIKEQAPDNVRLFAFGVGDDVDTFLLDSLAQNHGGTTTYVRPGQQIDEAVSSFYAKVSTPVLANIELDFDDIVVEQLYPSDLPDLFAGTQLVLTGRYREGGPATITLTGEVNGQEQSYRYEDNIFRNSGGDEFIPRLWATRAIGNLLTQIRLHGEDPELVQSVIELSIRYGIITPYTSYLIEEDDIFSQSGRQIIMEEELMEFAEPVEATGGKAVSEAADQGAMAVAEAPVAAPEATVVMESGEVRSVNEVVQSIGSKTFVQRDGLWIDTEFDPDRLTPERIGFASDTYFELLSAAPALGQYLALGLQVLVVYEGIAYQIVEGEGQGSVTLPEPPASDAQAPAVITPDQEDVDLVTPATDNQPDQSDGQAPTSTTPAGDGEADQESGGVSICGIPLIAPLMMVGVVLIFRRQGAKNKR